MVSKLDQLREKARAKAKAQIKPTKKAPQEPAQVMAYAYEQVLGEYSLRPALKFIKTWNPDHINSKYFRKAAEIADEIGADYEQFVWAQFYFMHKWFGRETKPYELRSTKGQLSACERHADYKKMLEAGEIDAKVYASTMPVSRTDLKKIAEHNEKRLKRIMGKWNVDEEEAIRKFHPIFDLQWLKKNTIYRRLKKAGNLAP